MANNRMYLVCATCLENPDVSLEDSQFYLAKYYRPPTGWYVVYGSSQTRAELADSLDAFFDRHHHKEAEWEKRMYGDHFVIVTETSLSAAGDEFTQSKRGVMEALAKLQRS